jgi:acylphosphatase
MPSVHLLISGRVQGVFFRATARDVAMELGITGWIRNTPEGKVEAEISGDQQSVDHFITWSKQGPTGAVVQSVVVTPIDCKTFERFEIRRGS